MSRGWVGTTQALGRLRAEVSPALSCPVLRPRSASMRLPAGTVKLGEKLERYHTAIQVGSALVEGPWYLTSLLGVGCVPHLRGSPVCVLCFQRSESVKSPGASRTEFFVAPVGVASKRHLFEKELVGQSRAEPASSRKVRGSGPAGCL